MERFGSNRRVSTSFASRYTVTRIRRLVENETREREREREEKKGSAVRVFSKRKDRYFVWNGWIGGKKRTPATGERSERTR